MRISYSRMREESAAAKRRRLWACADVVYFVDCESARWFVISRTYVHVCGVPMFVAVIDRCFMMIEWSSLSLMALRAIGGNLAILLVGGLFHSYWFTAITNSLTFYVAQSLACCCCRLAQSVLPFCIGTVFRYYLYLLPVYIIMYVLLCNSIPLASPFHCSSQVLLRFPHSRQIDR